jgi:hypothetical protein
MTVEAPVPGECLQKTATSTSMCAYLRPSMACEIFWRHSPGTSAIGHMSLPEQTVPDQNTEVAAGCETAFKKCAEPWMAEPKRHMDVP